AARQLTQKLDHEPSAEEIAEMLDVPLEDVKKLLGLNDKVTSVDSPIGIQQSPKMDYKALFNPHQLLIDGQWREA
ncbi:MAG: hypothetical protein NT095_10015, partial [Burkholderiales bacterium]|nr:hypothetical protein [Burkholderiales bacterium]